MLVNNQPALRLRKTYLVRILAKLAMQEPITDEAYQEEKTVCSAETFLLTSTPGGAIMHPESFPDISPCRVPRKNRNALNNAECAGRGASKSACNLGDTRERQERSDSTQDDGDSQKNETCNQRRMCDDRERQCQSRATVHF